MAKLRDINTSAKTSKNKVQAIKDFLEEHYEIKMNVFNPNKSIIVPKTRDYDNPVTFADISLHLIEEDIPHNDTILRKILRSPNQVKTFNPIVDYFESIKDKWKGVSHIDLMAAHFNVREYGDRGKGYYSKLMYAYFKKWLVSVVACALGKEPNPVSLGLVHSDEGIGKTHFFNFITPDPLKSLLITPSDENKKFNMEESFARNFMVFFDELVGITSRNVDAFKKIHTSSHIDVYLPREEFPIRMPRVASSCFTTNQTPEKGGFLSPSMGARRFFVIEIEKINRDYSKKIDIDQIWAEAQVLMNSDYNYKWDIEDFILLRDINQRYMIETPSKKFVKLFLQKPVNGQDGEWLQAQEIAQKLVVGRMVPSDQRAKINEQKIGEALKHLGFERKSIRRGSSPLYCYNVRFVN